MVCLTLFSQGQNTKISQQEVTEVDLFFSELIAAAKVQDKVALKTMLYTSKKKTSNIFRDQLLTSILHNDEKDYSKYGYSNRAIKYVKDSLENLIQYISKTRYDEMAISQEYHKLTKQLDKHHIYTLDYKGTKMVFLNTKKGLKIFSFNNLNNLIRFIHRDRFVPKLAEKPDNVLLQQSAETFAKEIATTLFGKNINDYYSLLGDTIWSLNNEGYALRKPEAHEYAPIIKEAFKSDHFSYDKYIEDYSLKVYPANEFYASGKLPNYLKTNENDWLFFGYKPKHHTRPSFEVSQEAFYYLMTRVDGRWQISGMIE